MASRGVVGVGVVGVVGREVLGGRHPIRFAKTKTRSQFDLAELSQPQN